MDYNETTYRRLTYLNDRVRIGTATKEERDEYMRLMYEHGQLTKSQYDQYREGQNQELIVSTALGMTIHNGDALEMMVLELSHCRACPRFSLPASLAMRCLSSPQIATLIRS